MSYLQGVDEQIKIFFYSLGTGGILSLIYDSFRIIRDSFKSNKLTTFLCDLIFSVIASIITFLYLLLMNNGRIRLYIFIGEALGFLIWYFTLGQIFKSAINSLKRKIQSTQTKLKGLFMKLKNKKLPIKHFNALKTRLDAKKGS